MRNIRWPRGLLLGLLSVVAAEAGCGSSPPAEETATARRPGHVAPSPAVQRAQPPLGRADEPQEGAKRAPAAERPKLPAAPPGRADEPTDAVRAAAAGLRQLEGRHITIFTDLPPAAEVDELPAVFDRAVPQWCRYFDVAPQRVDQWRMIAMVMGEKARFQAAGLLPAELPPFRHGFSRGGRLWVYDQPSAYYRRHLLLHEGTHGFMRRWLGGSGPPWYSEGMAELLGTHRWENGRLQLGCMPRSREEVPYWGRIKVIEDRRQSGSIESIDQILNYPQNTFLDTKAYAWCWALVFMLDHHPDFKGRFRALQQYVRDAAALNEQLRNTMRDRWQLLAEQWWLFADELQYGYDLPRAAVVYRPGRPLTASTTVTVVADRGWQSTGILLEEGRSYKIAAQGRYQIAAGPKPWWCEPGGVTIHYYRGRPLGMLLGALRDDRHPIDGRPQLASSAPIGLGRVITPRRSGTLYLRINESPASLHDNAGQLRVRIDPP